MHTPSNDDKLLNNELQGGIKATCICECQHTRGSQDSQSPTICIASKIWGDINGSPLPTAHWLISQTKTTPSALALHYTETT
jgi:hypothetical protein